MTSAEQVRTALRTRWNRDVRECLPLTGGMNSSAWRIAVGTEHLVAKAVPGSHRGRFEAGLVVAESVEAGGISAGAPIRAADGALTVRLDGEVLAVLRWVPGRPLDAGHPMDQQWWGTTLAAVHRGLAGFTHPQLTRFHWVRPEAAHLDVEPWIRPAVGAAVTGVNRLRVTDQLTHGVVHGDPAPTEFRLDPATGRVGLLDWGSAVCGPLMYDLASAVMYAGGIDAAGELLDGYLSAGVVTWAECDSALPTMLRFRWAVQADYFAWRIATDDRTGITDPAQNWEGLHDARDAFVQDER